MNSSNTGQDAIFHELEHVYRQEDQKARVLTYSMAKRQIPAYLRPGRAVTGFYTRLDHSQGMLKLQLSTGERGVMSIYELPDDFFDGRACDTLVTGTVDRVEFDDSNAMTVIVKGEEFCPLY